MMTAVEFDFAAKQERTIPIEEAAGSCARGNFCWIDLNAAADRAGTEHVLRGMGIDAHAIEEIFTPDSEGRHDVYDDYLHISIAAGGFEEGRLVLSLVDALIGESFFITIRRGEVDFLKRVRRTYRQDFYKFAKTPSFLLYEFWDHLIESYRKADRSLGDLVRQVQDQIFGDIDDAIFGRVAEVSRDLLALRKVILASREVLGELTTRRSSFVAETSLPFLEKMVGTLERNAADLSVEREMLSETLSLYMGIVSHRTNKVLNRLTVISLVFLPLTFLCGVYGMNFEVLPEVRWKYGYLYFWSLAILIVSSTIYIVKKRGWL